MTSRYKQRLLTHLKHRAYEPSPPEQLADDLMIDDADRDGFLSAVQKLVEQGDIVINKHELVTLPPPGEEMIGSFRKNERGFGFIIPDDPVEHGDLFVPAGATMDAFTGDRVRARVLESNRHRPGQSPFVGEIVEILTRKQSAFTGEVFQSEGLWWAHTDGKVLPEPVVLKDADSKNVKPGDKVVFEIINYPEGDHFGEGVITKVLGDSGKPNVETEAVIHAFQLPGEFPEACVDEARALTRKFDEYLGPIERGEVTLDPHERKDLRDTFICTIDPPDAKDYDDAISLEKLDNGNWRLGVHIADVASFVTPGSALDDEASKRGNSTYLPRLVIPMLPEVLSNGICSLQEGVPRHAKSVFIDYDQRGNVKGTGFAATLIKSAKRMTYLEAQALIEGDLEEAKTHAKTDTPHSDRLIRAVKDMHTLAKAIERRRADNGMIHLDLPEVELVYDADGRVVDAEPEDDAYTHTLIEMFMVEANEAVARLFDRLDVPLIRRTHPEPVPGQTEGLKDFVRVAGYRIPKSPTREDLQALLNATKGTPAAPAVHMAVLRTLTRAEYSPARIGHFALASDAYAHFTSPIRRYTDLTAHRSITQFLEFTKNGHKPPRSDEDFVKLGKRLRETPACPDEQALGQVSLTCNRTEENSTAAERELRQFLVLQHLADHIGDSVPAIVTGVTPKGVFLRLDKYLAEGMCKVEDLPVPTPASHSGGSGRNFHKRALWKIDRKSGALVEVNSGRSYNIGDRVDVTISAIDLPRRQMELLVTDGDARNVGRSKRTGNRDFAGVHGAPAAGPMGLTLGDEVGELKPSKTGAERRSQRSRSRDKRKSDFRSDRKGKGKRQ